MGDTMAGARCAWAVAVFLGCVLVDLPVAHAVVRSCGPDAVANTASVLCAAPSGPCTASTVTVSSNLEVTDAGCAFDLGGRALQVQRLFQMTGLGSITVFNAGDITLTATGSLRARGDFAVPTGVVDEGGLISLVSTGTITLANGAVIDVSGDPAGSIVLSAAGANASGVGITLQLGSVLQGIGGSAFIDVQDRFADGASVELTATTGAIFDGALIDVHTGQSQGGELDITAARGVTIANVVDASGGTDDGGVVDINAGDSVVVSRTIDVSSHFGGGSGGSLSFSAGLDDLGVPNGVPGGGVTLDLTNGARFWADASDSDSSSGDGGDIEIDANGPVQFINGTGTAVHADGGTSFYGSGGSLFIDTGDFDPYRIGPLDGDMVLNGTIHATSGKLGGTGGDIELSAGRNLTLNGILTLGGSDGGGDVEGDAGGTILLNGPIDVHGKDEGGSLDFESGLAQGGAGGALTVAASVLATAGPANGGSETLSFAGCQLTVNANVRIDGTGGTSVTNVPGGADIELISLGPMTLTANSQYLAPPGGETVLTHPAAQLPHRTGAVFNPAPTDNPRELATGFYPNCPICGDGIRQAGEVCDTGAAADGACCNAACSAFTCPTTTPTPTPTPVGDTTMTASALVQSPTPTPQGSAAPSATATVTRTATPTPMPTATPTNTPTVLVTATTGPTPAPPSNIDHFKCYRAKTTGASAFVRQEVTLDDPFESKITEVGKTQSFCNGVDANGQGIDDPAAHLQCYRTSDAAGQGRFNARTVVVDDEFGTRSLVAKHSGLLCVPSLKDGAPSPLHLDHFKCYSTKPPTGSPRFVPQQLTLADQFESKLTTVGKPASICNAVDENGGGALNPSSELHCYAIKDAPHQARFPRQSVTASNHFGSEQLVVVKPYLLCVPSARRAPPRCGDGFVDPGEFCDDGNLVDGDGCSAVCTLESCGNGTVEVGEQCDDGALNGTDACCSSGCALVDSDHDGICDRDDVCPADTDNDSDGDGFCIGLAFTPPKIGGGDPCSRPPGTGEWVKPRLTMTRLGAPAGDEKLGLKGAFTISSDGPTIAPETFGVHLRILDRAQNIVVDEHVPGGLFPIGGQRIGWKVAGTPPRKWTYSDRVNTPPAHNGIAKIAIAEKANVIAVAVGGVNGTYGLAPGQEPVTVDFELNDTAFPPGALPGVDQCGEVAFKLAPSIPSCQFSGGALGNQKLICR
jgi:cysteine-rich repeat protein